MPQALPSLFAHMYVFIMKKQKTKGQVHYEQNIMTFRQHLHLCYYYIWHNTADGYESLVSSRGEKAHTWPLGRVMPGADRLTSCQENPRNGSLNVPLYSHPELLCLSTTSKAVHAGGQTISSLQYKKFPWIITKTIYSMHGALPIFMIGMR